MSVMDTKEIEVEEATSVQIDLIERVFTNPDKYGLVSGTGNYEFNYRIKSKTATSITIEIDYDYDDKYTEGMGDMLDGFIDGLKTAVVAAK